MLQRWGSLPLRLQPCSAAGIITRVPRTAARVLPKLTSFCRCHTAGGYSSWSHLALLYLPVSPYRKHSVSPSQAAKFKLCINVFGNQQDPINTPGTKCRAPGVWNVLMLMHNRYRVGFVFWTVSTTHPRITGGLFPFPLFFP